MKRIFYTLLGFLGVFLGALGAFVPMLPAVPFLMLAGFCFAKSSVKLDKWFKSTKLYRENLADYAAGRGMTKRVKVRIMVTVTILMSFGFLMMHAVPVGRIVLAIVWLLHLIYFIFGIKTLPAKTKETQIV